MSKIFSYFIAFFTLAYICYLFTLAFRQKSLIKKILYALIITLVSALVILEYFYSIFDNKIMNIVFGISALLFILLPNILEKKIIF